MMQEKKKKKDLTKEEIENLVRESLAKHHPFIVWEEEESGPEVKQEGNLQE